MNEKDYFNRDDKEALLASALAGDVSSLTSFLRQTVFFGELPSPYLRQLEARWSKKQLEDQLRSAQQHIHDKHINSIDFSDIKEQVELNVPNLKGHIKYDEEGVMYIKSPQMTYKTESLKELIKQLPDACRIILIGHRKSLLRKTAKDLGLELYLDIRDKDDYEHSLLKQTPRLAITWHSLYKISTSPMSDSFHIPTYDIVIFDESDQVFLDFYTADKNMTQAQKAITDRLLETLVQHSTLTVCLDADISDITKKAMMDYKDIDTFKHFIYINRFPVFRGSTFNFVNHDNWDGKMLQFLEDGEILYITCE